MICLRCDSEQFQEKNDAHIVQEFKGRTVEVITPAMECVKCGWLTLTTDQLDQLVKNTKASLCLTAPK